MEKNKRKKIISNLIQILKFTMFSISAGLIQFGSFALLNEVLHMTEWMAHLIALVLSVVWNFTLNRKFTFKSANNVGLAMFKVAIFYVAFTPLSSYLIQVLVNEGVDGLLAEFILMLLNFVLEFLYQRYFVFNPKFDIKKQEPLKKKVFLIERKK